MEFTRAVKAKHTLSLVFLCTSPLVLQYAQVSAPFFFLMLCISISIESNCVLFHLGLPFHVERLGVEEQKHFHTQSPAGGKDSREGQGKMLTFSSLCQRCS